MFHVRRNSYTINLLDHEDDVSQDADVEYTPLPPGDEEASGPATAPIQINLAERESRMLCIGAKLALL